MTAMQGGEPMDVHRCSVCGASHAAIKHHSRDEVKDAVHARMRSLSVRITPDDPDFVRRELHRAVGSILTPADPDSP